MFGKPSLPEKNQPRIIQQVIDLTHSETPLGQNHYYYLQMPGTKFCTKINIFCYSMSESADAVQMHEIPAVVPQPQPVLEMRHS